MSVSKTPQHLRVRVVSILWGFGFATFLFALNSTAKSFTEKPWKSWASHAAGHEAIVVVAGVFVTNKTSPAVINAFHSAAMDYNAAQSEVQVIMRFFIGNSSHEMVDQQLAVTGTTPQNRLCIGSCLPEFVIDEVSENMNKGKTRHWFIWASQVFPFSDWILKVDTDTAIDWFTYGSLLNNILTDTSSSMRYVGMIIDHGICPHSSCPPQHCTSMTGNCWVFMTGGLYGVSTRLAKLLAQCTWWKLHVIGAEDMQLGKAVKHCSADVHSLQLVNFTMGPQTGFCHSKNSTPSHIRYGIMPDRCGPRG